MRSAHLGQAFSFRYAFTWEQEASEGTSSSCRRGSTLFFTDIVLGQDLITLDGTKLTGKAAGAGGLLVWASTVNGPSPPTKGTSRVLVWVTP